LFLPAENFVEGKKFYSEILGLEAKFEFAVQCMIVFKIGNEESAIILLK
jgi:predicted enzyme related to lactoylglutathione lyase